MKKWKILLLIPYLLIAVWIAFWWLSVEKLGFAAIVLVPLFTLFGIAAAVIYTAVLGVALLVRWLTKRKSTKK